MSASGTAAATAVASSPLHELPSVGPPSQKDVEGYREDMRVETPEDTLSQAVVEGEGGTSGAGFPAGYDSRQYGCADAPRGGEGGGY